MTRFSRETFRFLSDLAANNRRDWFDQNRDRYERHVREPAQEFIVAVGERLDDISPQLRADPRPVGGSLFRIYRDVRFSKDKSPFKTASGIQFRHAAGKDAHAPGLYLHIEPRNCFVGMGAWRPAGPALRAIREGLAADPGGWREAVNDPAFKRSFELGGESLMRPPRGFDPEHPLVEDLKRKDFVAFAAVPQAFLTGADLVDDFLSLCAPGRPFLQFLCTALGVPF
ncbi:MAG: DUF2461 domain-containing protein [Gemmatimonadales bacterium]|nr:MAG: DUF2461 domain-containing protein [Gemmatimonadales bacterium]